jgi:F5/8 type C domain
VKSLPVPTAPAAWTSPVPSSDYGAVLELPLAAGSEMDAAAVYRSIFHAHPTLNGFSGFFPPYYSLMQLGLESGDQRVLSEIATWGRILIAIDRRNDPKGDWVRYVSAHQGVVAAGSSDTWNFFLLPEAAAERPSAMTGGELVPQQITSNFDSSRTSDLLDDNPFTRWATRGPQRGTEQLVVDLGAAKELSGVVLSLGRYALDFPRSLVIETSLDGERWITVWHGPTVALSVVAALSDPRNINLEFRLNAPTGRFVRLRQTQADAEHGWSIAKLSVFGTAL